MISVSQLRNVGIIDNCGIIIDHPELSIKQSAYVIKEILEICNNKNGTLEKNMENYLHITNCSGSTLQISFPEYIIRGIIKEYGSKMIDYLLLEDDFNWKKR